MSLNNERQSLSLYFPVSRNVMGFWKNLLHVVVSRIWSIFQYNIQQKRSLTWCKDIHNLLKNLLNWWYIITFLNYSSNASFQFILCWYFTWLRSQLCRKVSRAFLLSLVFSGCSPPSPSSYASWLVGNKKLSCESMDTFRTCTCLQRKFLCKTST